MRKIVIIFCLAILFAGNICVDYACCESVLRSDTEGGGAVDVSGQKKHSTRFNGYDWNRMNRLIQSGEPYVGMMGKAVMVRATCEGAMTIDNFKTRKAYNTTVKYGTFVKSLDKFYCYKANMKIPVAEAMKVISMEFGGASNLVVDDATKAMRSKF